MKIWKHLAALICAASLIVAPGSALAKPAKQKTARSEVDKAVGKCIGAVVGGAVLGALLGGKNNRGSGALIGGGIGGAACAAIMAAAKRKDRILAAQRAAAAAGTPQWASFQDEGGQAVQLASRTQDARIEGKILPVRYEQDGQKMVSPDLGEGPRQCRYVSTEMTGAQTGTAALPNQLFCRTSEGSWEPYATA